MRAIILSNFGGPECLVATDIEVPQTREGWVSVELRASALNWHDVLVRRGVYGSPLPHTPGADGTGVRMDTGEEVVILPSLFWGSQSDSPATKFEILGDFTSGTYARIVNVPEECLAPKPPNLSWAEAAALPLVGVTSFRALVTRAELQCGESLLIIGASGGISSMALNLAKGLGARTFVTASSKEKLEFAISRGAENGVLHSSDSWPQAAKAMSPGGRGFDVVLDSAGIWDQSVQSLRPGGRLVALGTNAAEHVSMNVRAFHFGQYSLLGTTMGGPQDFHALLDLVATGRVAPPPIAACFPLDDAAAAHRLLEAGRAYGKVVLTG